MNLLERMADRWLSPLVDRRVESRLAGLNAAAALEATVEQRVAARVESLREAAGASEDLGFRRLTTDKRRDLSPSTAHRAREVSVLLWQANPLAKRIVELIGEWVVGEGITYACPNPKAKALLDAHWRRRANHWDRKARRRVRELYLFGDQTWPVFTNQYSGVMSLGTLDPSVIKEVVVDPHNSEVPIGIVTRSGLYTPERRLRTVLLQEDVESLSPAAEAERARFADGETHYFAVDNLSTMSRGVPVLFSLADSLDGYDQLLFALLQKEIAAAHVLFDVTLEGADQDTVNKRMAEIGAPRPMTVRVHNEREKWAMVAPDLGEGTTDSLRAQRNHVLGGAQIPEHWYGGGGDVNRAAAAEMGAPTEKSMAARQRDVKYILEDVLVAQVERGIELGVIPEADDAREVTVNMPELSSRDITRLTTALQATASAFAIAAGEGWMDDKVPVTVLSSLVSQMGVEVDPETLLDEARTKRAGRLADEASRALEDRAA